MREWNALHGGVYVPMSTYAESNPYLDDPLRDIKINEKLTLTKINPACMTPQISEIKAPAKVKNLAHRVLRVLSMHLFNISG